MLSANEFDHQSAFDNAKVGDERADRVLLTKLCIAELSAAQPRPELLSASVCSRRKRREFNFCF
jgi:hypothetical protein